MDRKRNLKSVLSGGRLSILLGFFISFVAAVVLFYFGPFGIWEDLYLSASLPPVGILLRSIFPSAVAASLTSSTCVSAPAILSACLTWGGLISMVLYAFLRRRRTFSDKVAKVNKAGKYLFIGLTAFIWIFFLFNVFVVFSLHGLPFYDRSFDQTVWRSQNQDSGDRDNPRGTMAKDLQNRLLGKKPTKTEVLALLGQPDLMSEADKQRFDFLSYSLGAWSGFRIDYDSLDIFFDTNDRVCRVCIIQH